MKRRAPTLVVVGLILTLVAGCGRPTPVATPADSATQAAMVQPTALPTITSIPSPTAAPTATLTRAPTATATRTPTPGPTKTPAPRRLFTDKIPAPSLAGNLLGDATERLVTVYLPPSYYASEERFPAVYYLPGFGDTSMIGFDLPRDADELIAKGSMKEMILVIASGGNVLGGSFYVNSPVTGNWDDFIVQDVVGYVDTHYRTVASADARGIAGHSMGGFGALNIAMRHPETFSTVFAMSPGLFDENGLAESQMFATQPAINSYLAKEQAVAGLPAAQAVQEMRRGGSDLVFTLAYGAAFSPDPGGTPPFIRYPYRLVDGKLVRDDEAWQAWESGFGGIAEEVRQYRANLLQLKGLVVDYGKQDAYRWIPKGCEYYAAQLTAQGIPHQLIANDGSHQSYVGKHIREVMLPFFSKTLGFP